MLPKFLEKLSEWLEKIKVDDTMIADKKIQPGEEIIGVVSEPIRRLVCLIAKMESELSDSMEMHINGHRAGAFKGDCPECRKFHRDINARSSTINVLTSIFMRSLSHEFPDHRVIGVREGWQVVWSRAEEELIEAAEKRQQEDFELSMAVKDAIDAMFRDWEKNNNDDDNPNSDPDRPLAW